MANIESLSKEEIASVAQHMGYDPEKHADLQRCKTVILNMDLWDIKRALFFGEGPQREIS